MQTVSAQLFVVLQKLLPKYLLTRLVYRVARLRYVPLKNFLIRRFVGIYNVDIDELTHPVPDGYASFNDFFIRDLAPGARTIDAAPGSIVSPVDGTISAAGRIDRDRLMQAKGRYYALADLLATDVQEAEQFADGSFATIYLAPFNYHRVHAPLDGRLVAATYVPGGLYSVSEATVNGLPGLFTGNERLVCRIETGNGPMALIFVGALNVGTINTIWSGDIRPRKHGVAETLDIRKAGDACSFSKGDTLGWFNMGSTVILLLPPGGAEGFGDLHTGATVRMGQAIGRTGGAADAAQ